MLRFAKQGGYLYETVDQSGSGDKYLYHPGLPVHGNPGLSQCGGRLCRILADEIGELVASANRMRDKLRHLLLGVNDSTDSVTESAEMLKEQAEQTRLSIQQVAESAVHLAEGMNQQVDIVTGWQPHCYRRSAERVGGNRAAGRYHA